MAEGDSKVAGKKIFNSPVEEFKKLFRPPKLSQKSFCTWYVPAAGGISYSAFAVHIFHPHALQSVFPEIKHAVANSLLFNAHLGTGLYLYHRKQLATLPKFYRIGLSVYGTLIFNFGSVLLWAVTKVILPDNNFLRAFFAISSSFCMIFIGKEYIDYVDRNIE